MDRELSSNDALFGASDIALHTQSSPDSQKQESSGQLDLDARVNKSQEPNARSTNKLTNQSKELHHQIPNLKKARKQETVLEDEIAEKQAVSQEQRKEEPEGLIARFIKSNFIQQDISNASNIFSLVGNGISSLANLLPLSDKTQKFASKIGEFATKFTLGVNGAIGGLNQLFLKKNPISGLMHLAENLVIALFPQNQIYFVRGLNSGVNLMTFGLNQYDKKDKFDSYGDYLSTIIPNVKQAFAEISLKHMPKDETDFFIRVGKYFSNAFKNIISKASGLITIINGFGMVLGTSIGMFTPFKFLGEIIRNTAGLIQDFDRLKDKEKINNFRSGLAFFAGSALNYSLVLTKQVIGKKAYNKLESVLVPLVFAADGLARYFFRKSQDEGEQIKSKQA